MSKIYTSLISDLRKKLELCKTHHDLANVKSAYLGKDGFVTKEFSKIKSASLEEKKLLGKSLNLLKNEVNLLISDRYNYLNKNKSKESEHTDVTLPGNNILIGSRHPISITIDSIVDILGSYGFETVTGIEIEDEFHNFEALNISENHPARDMHDTFYISEDKLLRTHTSSVQIRTMLTNEPPLKIMTPGKVYRCDSDTTHSPMFHQIEGLHIDENINFCHLKGTLINFIEEFFGKKMETRFRPSYFPFTEPSAELDIKFNGKWLEVLGCGMVHTSVLKNVKINPNDFSGYAFGLGIERLAMLKFGITDL